MESLALIAPGAGDRGWAIASYFRFQFADGVDFLYFFIFF